MTSNAATSKTKATHKHPALSFRDQLLAESPKLDAALKSFCSWIVASASTASPLDTTDAAPTTQTDADSSDSTQPVQWTLQSALTCTRHLSKAINGHVAPIHYDKGQTPQATPERLMKEVTTQVWNELAAQPGTKITKVLGRTALQYVWKDLDLTDLKNTAEGAAYCQLFEQLLFLKNYTHNRQLDVTSDASLVWGGPNVMAQRAAERQATAATRVQAEQDRVRHAVTTPVIEELPDEEDDKKPAAVE